MNLQMLRISNLWRNVIPLSTRFSHSYKSNFIQPKILEKAKYSLGLSGDLRYPTTVLRMSGEKLFIVCAEYPVFEDFVQHLKLPDTFQTWFSLTVLHIWMCFVRLRREGEEGYLMKKWMDKALWADMPRRMRAFKILLKSSSQIKVFRTQYYGSMFAYDEALLSYSDSHFAAALWSNMWFSSPTATFQEIELLIKYVRKQLEHLDKTSSTVIFRSGAPAFLPLMKDEIDIPFAQNRIKYCLTFPEHLK
ncbi:Ubiquinol-cytochrome-c reductase complex assembly factor 1 [Schistosoma japonicum]|nr:Ubiquinol-cytochrome-c reductase complex assembly factor 1 [Schistosoma japonicum]KAH8877956.1 Ubiquinol-cytochrome-c reductase complex assembly factor 1 [Schistosoma japonicum]